MACRAILRLESFFACDAFENSLAQQALLLFHRQEHHANGVTSRVGQRESELRAFIGKKLVRDFDQDACAVARFRVAAARAAMR